MNLLKVAFYQGANQALVDLGISKLAANAPPITDNPYEDAPGANVKKVLGTSLEEIDDMFARIDAMSKSKQTASSSKKPAAKSRPVMNFTLDDYNLGEGPNPYAKKPAVAANKPAPRAVARKPEVTPAPGTGNKPSDGKLRAAFPNSPGLVDAMRLGLTNQERQVGLSPRAPGSAPPKAPAKPGRTRSFDEIADSNSGPLKSLFPKSPGLVDAMSRGLTAPISPREFSDSFSDSPKSAPSKEPRVVAGKPRVTPIPGTRNKPSDGKLRAAFPDSPGLVDAMRLGLTNQERQIGISPKATGSAPPKAPKKPMGNS